MQSGNDRCISIILQVKYRGGLIAKLKAIKFKKDTFYYLSFYLYCSFF